MFPKLFSSVLLLFLFPVLVFGQESSQTPTFSKNTLFKKHSLSVRFGVSGQAKSTTEVSGGGVTTQTSASGFTAYLNYSHWFRPDWALFISSGALQLDFESRVEGIEAANETGTIIPLLFGVKYQPEKFSLDLVIRPFISLAMGPYFGVSTVSSAGLTVTNETNSETAFGARLGAGIDGILGNWFLIGFDAGYHFVSDFQNPIGNEKNYSGPEILVTIGFIWGKGAGD